MVNSSAMTHDGLPKLEKDTALFLDVDGTLLEIAPAPDAVIVPRELNLLLRGLHTGLGGAVALVTGRSLSDLDALFAPLRLPAAGQHGAELRRRGDMPSAALTRDARLDAFAERMRAFAGARPGLLVEDKGLSIAIHYRRAPQYGEEVHHLAASLIIESGADIELMQLRMAVELKPRAISKRSAVAWFMREPPFRGRVPVFVGDDRTDEDGFAAALELGGHAVRVGREGSSIAPTRIATPHAVREWLAAEAGKLR